MIPNIAQHCTPEEKARYKAISHDIEESRANIVGLEKQREHLIKTIMERLTVIIIPLPRKQFEHKMARARTMLSIGSNDSEYWIGYQRGLRRAHHGEYFGTREEHNIWLASIDSTDELRKMRGQGYRDGLTGKSKGDSNASN